MRSSNEILEYSVFLLGRLLELFHKFLGEFFLPLVRTLRRFRVNEERVAEFLCLLTSSDTVDALNATADEESHHGVTEAFEEIGGEQFVGFVGTTIALFQTIELGELDRVVNQAFEGILLAACLLAEVGVATDVGVGNRNQLGECRPRWLEGKDVGDFDFRGLEIERIGRGGDLEEGTLHEAAPEVADLAGDLVGLDNLGLLRITDGGVVGLVVDDENSLARHG